MDTLHYFKVIDSQTFIDFFDLLRQDYITNLESWENKKSPNFLETLSVYVVYIYGYYDNMKMDVNADKPTLQTFAEILKGATIYE